MKIEKKLKKFSLKKLIDDDRYLRVFSVVIAIVIWFAVINLISDEAPRSISGVSLDIESQMADLRQMGLVPIEGADQKIEVVVEGKRTVVGNLQPEDINAVLELTGIDSPGTYDLKVNVSKNNANDDYQIISVRPETVRMVFDRETSKKLTIEIDITGTSAPEGYLMETVYASVREVTVSGPESAVQNISRCVAKVSRGDNLTQTAVVNTELEFYNVDGQPSDMSQVTVDRETVDVTIPVLQIKTLPVKVSFINMPSGFDMDTLEYTLSQDTIEIAGPTDVMANLSEYNLGYIDFKQLSTEGFQEFDIILPVGYLNIQSVDKIGVTFNMEDKIEKEFTVQDIRVVNGPSNYTITVNTRQINKVKIIGNAETIEALSSQDIVAEIDFLSSEISTGQYQMPAHIVVPGKNDVWIYGEYSVVVTVRQDS